MDMENMTDFLLSELLSWKVNILETTNITEDNINIGLLTPYIDTIKHNPNDELIDMLYYRLKDDK
jgi:hypothetical protein